MKKVLFLIATIVLCSALSFASAGATVNFPSDTTWYSTTVGSGFIGSNGGFSAPLSSAGDFISETFVTGQTSVTSLTADWSLVNYFGNNPGATYENDIYVNGAFVGYFLVGDCGFCANVESVTGTVYFNPIYAPGTYTISVVLSQSAPANGGSEYFTEWNINGAAATATLGTPEPGTLTLLASGVLGLAGLVRRKLY